MTSATDYLIEGITGLIVIAIKQISTFMSKRFRNITLSPVGRALDCGAGGRGRTNTQGLKNN